MKLAIARLLLVLAAGFLLGADAPKVPQSPQESSVREITPEKVRAALIDFIEHSSDSWLKPSLSLVKNAKITPSAVGGKWLDIGPWACLLEERKVSMMVGGPPGVAPFIGYQGNLELSADGKCRVINVRGGYVGVSKPPPPPPPKLTPPG
jgi:hypothetical protein